MIASDLFINSRMLATNITLKFSMSYVQWRDVSRCASLEMCSHFKSQVLKKFPGKGQL